VKISEVASPIGKFNRRKLDFFEVVGGQSKWVTAYHGTATTFDQLHALHQGIIWATMSPEHASSYAMSLRAHFQAKRNQAAPAVHPLRVNIAGFLIVDGGGREIREIDATDWLGWSPYDIVAEHNLPGILFRQVYDTIEEDVFHRRINVLAIGDPSRVRPLFGNQA
jgi:hypothetical protein